jgi:hypothetical protein
MTRTMKKPLIPRPLLLPRRRRGVRLLCCTLVLEALRRGDRIVHSYSPSLEATIKGIWFLHKQCSDEDGYNLEYAVELAEQHDDLSSPSNRTRENCKVGESAKLLFRFAKEDVQ